MKCKNTKNPCVDNPRWMYHHRLHDASPLLDTHYTDAAKEDIDDMNPRRLGDAQMISRSTSDRCSRLPCTNFEGAEMKLDEMTLSTNPKAIRMRYRPRNWNIFLSACPTTQARILMRSRGPCSPLKYS
jgi:hypothetical protein